MSQNYDYSNQSGDDASLGYISPSLNNSSSSNQKELVQAVNTTDGSNVFYHITEVPDAHPQEPPAPPINYNDDNVLTTPMVRAEEMARTQMLRQKNRQRRKEMVASPDSMSSGSPKGNNNNSDVTKPKQQRLQQRPQQQQQMLSQAQELPQPLQIKSEDEPLDPLIFLNVYPDSSGGMTPDPNLISPNLSEESRQSSATNGAGNYMLKSPSLSQGAAGNNSNNGARVSPTENNLLTAGTTTTTTNNDLYNPSNFITNDMPAEIFEVSWKWEALIFFWK